MWSPLSVSLCPVQRFSASWSCVAVQFGKNLSCLTHSSSSNNNNNIEDGQQQQRRWNRRHLTTVENRRGYGSATIASSTMPGALSKQQAKDLAIRLTSDERDVLISALQECQSRKVKAEYEGHLAAFRWRSKFGRPSRVPSLGDVDPTGSYCTVPDDWLLRKYVETVPQPAKSDLMRVSVANAIPFIGFGFLDNFIMIIAGEHIEASLGAVISLTTMAAAALGNTISDILGIGSAFYVELLAQKIGFRPPKLTPVQLDMPASRRAANMGRVIGVTIGCILGMFPLLLMGKETKKEDAPNDTLLGNTPTQTKPAANTDVVVVV